MEVDQKDIEKMGSRTYKALRHLWKNSKEMQELELVKQFRCQDSIAHAKEYCTISLKTARRSGHTTAIAKFITRHRDMDWLVIAPNLKTSERIRSVLCEKYGHNKVGKVTLLEINFIDNKTTRFSSIGSYEKDLRGTELDGIIVDCAFMLSQQDLTNIYNLGVASMRFKPHAYFIFVE